MNSQTYEITDQREVIDQWREKGIAVDVSEMQAADMEHMNRTQRREYARKNGLFAKNSR